MEVPRPLGYWLGQADPPACIDLLLTDACNLRCSYCPLWGEDAAPLAAKMAPTASLLAFVDDVAAFRPMLRFFGGEALLHPDWPLVVDRARAHGMFCTAVSNGIRLREQADQLLDSGMLAIGISLDGDATINDEFRGPGTFHRVAAGIRALAEAKRRLGRDTPHIEIFTTVTPSNYTRLVDWARSLSDWEISLFRLQHLIWFSPDQLAESMADLRGAIGETEFFRREETTYARSSAYGFDVDVLREQLEILRTEAFGFRVEEHPFVHPSETAGYFRDLDYTRGIDRSCRTIESCAYVDPRGRLYPCLTIDMGNVFERPFLEVWNGERFRSFRRLIRRKGRLALCHRCPDASGAWDGGSAAQRGQSPLL